MPSAFAGSGPGLGSAVTACTMLNTPRRHSQGYWEATTRVWCGPGSSPHGGGHGWAMVTHLRRVDAVEQAVLDQVLHDGGVVPHQPLPEPVQQLLVRLQAGRQKRLRGQQAGQCCRVPNGTLSRQGRALPARPVSACDVRQGALKSKSAQHTCAAVSGSARTGAAWESPCRTGQHGAQVCQMVS
jgi:hypothetical protein